MNRIHAVSAMSKRYGAFGLNSRANRWASAIWAGVIFVATSSRSFRA